MRNYAKKALAFLLILTIVFLPQAVNAEQLSKLPTYSSALELVAAVNALRASNGLPLYQPNSILMGIAQTQAEYLVSIGTITHGDSQGRLPFQRALAAGYPVVGDITNNVGFFSENICAGISQTADEAVQVWMGDEPHKNTMLSAILQDVGAGVGVNGNTYYYVLDAGLSTGGTPVAYTPPPPRVLATPTILPNTPNPDGSVIHIVKPGDTLGSISMAYGVPLADILKLNSLTVKSTIYVDQKIKIHSAFTPTATQPTSTPTELPTETPWPTATLTPTATDLPPTPTPSPGLPISAAAGAVGAIVVSAMVLAGVIAVLGGRRKQ